MNSCVGVVKEIVYKSTSGPANKDDLPVYVIVDFPSCTIPQEDALVPNMPPTCVPVPVVMDQCEKKCCSVKTIPLRVCIAIKVFEKVVVYLPEDQREQSPGLELVAFSRAKGPDCLAVENNSNNLTIMSIQKIGTSEKKKLRRKFQKKLKELSVTSQAATVEAIKELDPIQMDTEKTFKGGCEFLLDWFNSKIIT